MVAINGTEVGKLGYGAMGLTWRSEQTPDAKAFSLLRKAIDEGCTFWNLGEFYGMPEPTLNLQLFKRYFEKYPEDRSKVFLSVKGCVDLKSLQPDSSSANIRKSIENSVNTMGTHIDLFEPARVDKKRPIEEVVHDFETLIKEGKIKSMGLSEASAETIDKAASAGKIAAVEQEYSLWATEVETNGVVDALKKHNIPLIAYSPLGRGFLTGQIKSRDDLPENDMRRHFDRFSDENFDSNLEVAKKLEEFAKGKGCEPSQLAIAWVLAQQDVLGIKIVPIPGCTTEARLLENCKGRDVSLSTDELKEIRDLLDKMTIKGGRYNKHMEDTLFA
ncbi:NADP-dependent oxidoreductase domain-containing protein [Protomyces lactucae-debilis]|uniref:NADP-dependent oxidoreductase domain-containing protein n=1 Tax=Protomyces lactucae-debilis TaxID=2754530 RepID=A0A1Y2F950_PROLT|nr:NADP-dependent oxidoreductase domain-containing protein [Protomyces lactucae-debilis]ORY79425.1 NADP-dependent oxidoreductase domain-containing protein [Protomyces lactucae-debilis]